MLHGGLVKDPPAKTGDVGSIPGSGRCPGAGNGNTLHYSCLENSVDREAWPGYDPWVHKELDTNKLVCIHTVSLFKLNFCSVYNT